MRKEMYFQSLLYMCSQHVVLLHIVRGILYNKDMSIFFIWLLISCDAVLLLFLGCEPYCSIWFRKKSKCEHCWILQLQFAFKNNCLCMDISVECGIVASLLKVCAANWCLYSEIHPLNTFYQIFCTFWIYPCVLDLFSFSLIRESSPIMTDVTGFILPRTVCQYAVRC